MEINLFFLACNFPVNIEDLMRWAEIYESGQLLQLIATDELLVHQFVQCIYDPIVIFVKPL